MRFKLLLIFLFCAMGVLRAQDTIRTLIISEARLDNAHAAYVELTNVGSTTLDLSQFEFGKIGPWTTPYTPDNGAWLMLPKVNLEPGKSFVIAKISDFCTKMYPKYPDLYNQYESKPEMLKLANLQVHIPESPKPVPQSLDSISTYQDVVQLWGGSYLWYLRYHFTNNLGQRDSVVVDQVNGVFDGDAGKNKNIPYDCAGYKDASNNCVLIRKANITKGNTNYNLGRGTNAEESEWIAVPFLILNAGGWEPNRAVFWTTGNHGDYHLNSLISSVLTVNWTDSTLTVPWGVRRDDSIMYKFNRVPGIAWHYDYSKLHADSAMGSVRTGDKLTVYACGNKVEKIIFKIIASPSTNSDKLVIPKRVTDNRGRFTTTEFCRVSDKIPGMDTISLFPYGTRVDTLLKYLEKPDQASISFVWVDGVKRTEVKKGDILRVTAQNGTSKDYYLKPNKYFPNHNAYLSAITWPDIPDLYRDSYGWTGDTIPDFIASKYDYRLTVPWDVDGIPALVGSKQQLNSTLQVKKALNLTGTVADRTITFTNTAEDDTTVRVYKIELTKELDPSKIQPWNGEPFISQYVWQEDWKSNDFIEVVNPGTEPLDLSNYMITFGYVGSANEAITGNSGTGDFATRYRKYIPGYKWVDETTWATKSGTCTLDPSVNSFVKSGDVFVAAWIDGAKGDAAYPEKSIANSDIIFNKNTWGEDLTNPWDAAMRQWSGQKIFLFKILNDSIQRGLKAANDPRDFEVIDMMGMVSGDWKVAGISIGQRTQYIRKPGIYKGNPVIQASFGTNKDDSEWNVMTPSDYATLGYNWPTNELMVADNIGSHFMNTVTVYRSTVSSSIYKVSDGYSNAESIKGVIAGTTVDNFYTNIIKADTGQHLKVRKVADGSIISGTSVISNGDSLIVVSSDSVNTSKYIITVGPLSGDAVLTSETYAIAVNGSTGTVSNFAIDTKLITVVAGVKVPVGASMVVADAKGAYVPMKMLNYDTTYVDVKVNDQIRFEVTAENGTTKIVYSLKPTTANTDAYVTSSLYDIDQATGLIKIVPKGTSMEGFMQNIIPATGATVKVIDKYGLERTVGTIVKDDKVVVTAADGTTTKTYYLSMLSNVIEQYLAYVLSADYSVDQVGMKISGAINTSMKVSDLMAKLTPAPYAKVNCLTYSGAVKAGTSNLAIGDVIEVVSGDGSISNVYIISSLVKANVASTSNIVVYPNPSVDDVFVTGIESGNRISVYNSLGKLIMVKVARQGEEQISLSKQPKGVYIIKVSAKGKADITNKVVLK